ncbi:hypothetical protein LTR56_019413 [Elasticomyces elasticus]|nr:hypothetical protein LTR56_019413 [Elasticomyces elasticus]KAK4907309.1 hypothetical protein LTR49_023635 [Elasticomyces elasticus]
MRRVSKTLLALVDANLKSIVAPIRARALHSLEQFVNDTLNFGKNVPFHHALGRLIKHRGYWPLYTDCARTTQAFMMLWLYNLEGGPPPYHFVGPERIMTAYIADLADKLQELHLQRHAPEYRRQYGEKDIPDLEAFINLLGSPVNRAARRYNLGSSYLETVYHVICEPTNPVLGGQLHGLGSDDDLVRVRTPQWPLTKTFVTQADYDDKNARQRMNGICSMGCLVANFGVPELPGTPIDRFAYCVKTEWAYRMVEGAVRSGKGMKRLVKTAVLEELHIP